MTTLISLIGFVILMTALVIIHELGHYLVARWRGVEVDEFGFGLPPKAVSLFTKWGTEFTLNWIPFGGFVRLRGEADQKASKEPGSFAAASLWSRALILVAGVFMNLVLALIILFFGFWLTGWTPSFISLDSMEQAADRGELILETGIVVSGVTEAGPAKQANFPVPSIITEIDGVEILEAEDVVSAQLNKQEVTYTLEHGDNEVSDLTIALVDGKSGIVFQKTPLELEMVNKGIGASAYYSLREVGLVTVLTMKGIGGLFGSLFTQGAVPQEITGIVGIAQLTHQSLQTGFSQYFRLMALLSLSLAILNILPFPALDGGRLIFVILEAVRGKPVDRNLEMMVNTIGFAFILLLIVVITIADVIRLF